MRLPKYLPTLLALLLLPLATAQPVPKLNSVSKQWISRGAATEVTFSGENLGANPVLIVSGSPGVAITNAPNAMPSINVEGAAGVQSIVVKDLNNVAATLSVTPTAAIATREIRAITPTGISNPVTINISPVLELNEGGGPKSVAEPQSITIPCAISGVISGASETDHFKFHARKDQTIIVEAIAYRTGSALDSSVAILDKSGKELMRNEDAIGLDSLLQFKAPADDDYLVQIRDFRFQGGGNYNYRLIVGELPYVASVFPFGGQRGQNVQLELKGANLDGATQVTLHLDPDAALGKQQIRTSTPHGISNPFTFDVSDLPEFLEQEPNSALDQADVVSLPVVINGRIRGDHDYDAFKFHVEKDQQFIFELAANRFGSSLDALLTLMDDKGAILQRNDDADAGTGDARIDQRFAAAGNYFLIVEDLLHRNGDDYGYRLSATTPKPDFAVTSLSDRPRIRRDGRIPIRCEVNRMSGFGDTVTVTFANLPPGLYNEPLIFSPSSLSSAYLMLAASKDAPLGTTPIKLIATGMINGKQVTRTVQPLADDNKPVKEMYLTVLPPLPYSVAAGSLMAAVEQQQTAGIEVVVDRKDGFQGEIKVTPEGFSLGRDPASKSFEFQPLVLKPNETRGTLSLRAKLDSEVGTRPLLLRAESSVDGQTVNQFSGLLPVTITQVPFTISTTLKKLSLTALPPGTQSAAAEAFLLVRAERRAGFGGEIEITVEGVPEGIKLTADKIAANTGEATLKLLASEKAPVGKEFTLTITGSGVFNEKTYKFKAPAVALSVNAPEATEVKAVDAKPAAPPATAAK